MPTKTLIEWSDYTSNPIAPVGGGWGCTKISPGCDNCYAERLNKWRGNKRDFEGRWEFMLKPKELDGLRRLNDRGDTVRVFLGDMTDIFHPDVPFDMLLELFSVLDECPNLIVQTLTKRPKTMAHFSKLKLGGSWPANVWAGTSVESQEYVWRLDSLSQVPAKVRFVSYEPALGPVDFRPWLPGWADGTTHENPRGTERYDLDGSLVNPIDWVIAGGESGPGARPAHPDWFRSVRDQCQAAGVPFFFKQWGAYRPLIDEAVPRGTVLVNPDGTIGRHTKGTLHPDYHAMTRVGKKAAGALLDGREWREFPEVVS